MRRVNPLSFFVNVLLIFVAMFIIVNRCKRPNAVAQQFQHFKTIPVVDTTDTYPEPDSVVTLQDGVVYVLYK
jgi:hypothetical protein